MPRPPSRRPPQRPRWRSAPHRRGVSSWRRWSADAEPPGHFHLGSRRAAPPGSPGLRHPSGPNGLRRSANRSRSRSAPLRLPARRRSRHPGCSNRCWPGRSATALRCSWFGAGAPSEPRPGRSLPRPTSARRRRPTLVDRSGSRANLPRRRLGLRQTRWACGADGVAPWPPLRPPRAPLLRRAHVRPPTASPRCFRACCPHSWRLEPPLSCSLPLTVSFLFRPRRTNVLDRAGTRRLGPRRNAEVLMSSELRFGSHIRPDCDRSMEPAA